MKYMLIFATGPEELVADVAAALNDGWYCQGGVALERRIDQSPVYAQAMVRSEPQPAVVAPGREHNPAAD